MAVNRFMKPAEQPLMNTYVRLPFEQLSMAYNQIQKEHDAGEKLNDSLDDELLKVRASTPLHSQVLSQIRTNLDQSLDALYQKHGGRYADMVPELTAIKASLEKDFNDGSLYAIKETTRALEEDLNPGIAKAQEEGTYSAFYNPYFGAERDWTKFYNQGFKLNDQNQWVVDDGSIEGWTTTPDGRTILTPYAYKGVYKASDQLQEANEKTFDKIKSDYVKWVDENPNTGSTKTQEQKAITRSKVYQAAFTDLRYYPANMRQEIAFEVGKMTDKQKVDAAIHAVNAVYGDPAADTDEAAAKNAVIQDIKNNPDVANQWAMADYVGYMGEKYVFENNLQSETFDNGQFNKNRYPIEKTDWVPKVTGGTGFMAGNIRNVKNEPIADLNDPLNSYIEIVNNNSNAYKTVVNEYETTKANYSLDDPYHKEWQAKIDEAKFKYESSAMALFGLTQTAAKQLNAQRYMDNNGGGVRYQDGSGNWVYIPMVEADGTINSAWMTEGWGSIQFDDNGVPVDVEELNRQATAPDQNIYKYMDVAKGLFDNVFTGGGTQTSVLLNKVNQIQDNSNFFKGRNTSVDTYSSTGSKRVDAEISAKLPGLIGTEDQTFVTSDGEETSWKDLVQDDIVSQENLDQFLQGKMGEVVWLSQPNPDGTYYGMLTMPKEDEGNSAATIDLFFIAPPEVRRTWRNQFETTRPMGDGSGMTEYVTLPRTEAQKQLWDANERAQIDFARAARTPGNIAMSSAEDGENNPLGYYYFNQDPDGRPISNEQYVFQPRKGLIMDYVNGEPVFTTGNELFNIDSDAEQVGMLITLNDPTYAGAKAYFANNFNLNPNPIAREGIPVTEKSEARGIDVDGNYFSTNLRPGQIMLPEERINSSRMKVANNDSGMAFNNMYEGLNSTAAEILVETTQLFDTEWSTKLSNKIATTFSGTKLTRQDGTEVNFNTALANGDIELIPVSGVDGQFSLPITSGARSYEQQERMYNEWVEGGKQGPPVANPAEGGFHVFGQAIDLSWSERDYDWVLVDNTGQFKELNGNNSFTNVATTNGYDRTPVSKNGILVSSLVGSGNSKLFPDYNKSVLTSLFDKMSSTPQDIKDHHKRTGPYREANVLPDFKQFNPTEWWHWSLGEITNPTSGYVYPSWAN